ncbi:organic hydroperoxide resistance protein [Shewanella sp. C32]|uniref:Organic hydroperoxide resistance protein n=1 Tax=Shewanella electrica TaxID=515560 RepID=A0ABT2FLV5_9GAMM|nr:organic hydroperoxide resistance protein [Shewanella electrica]MCH1925798.1 organic hydroperoxide resistance protein [Shewanella electrica]MCS4557317.1 organic hydroperoxide resistance protein [Shewanella electrica]
MLKQELYRTAATATGGRDGYASTEDGSLHVWLGAPKELGGRGFGNNPEQLFATGYAACFLSAMKAVAASDKAKYVKVPDDTRVTAEVAIGPREEKGFGLAIALKIQMPNVDKAAAEALVAEAHQVCPYSNATRGNIDVQLTVL